MALQGADTNGDATLRLLDPTIASLIVAATDESQRRFAIACARHAVAKTGLSDLAVSESLAIAARAGVQDSHELRGRIEHVAAALDEAAFDVHDAVDAGRANYGEYEAAFGLARAATAAGCCLDLSARKAAATACYEALAALGDRAVVHIAALARETLSGGSG